MASQVKLPELGENLTSGDVLDVKVAPGDQVTQGQTLLEGEAEKSTIEVPAPTAGRVREMLVKKGQKIQVGQPLAVIEETDSARPETPKAPAPQPRGEQPPKEKPA